MEPILNGAPGFFLLGFVVALAGYLRQVSMNAQDRADQLKSGKYPELWPPQEESTLEKIHLPHNTKINIEWVTPRLFLLIAVISVRAVLYALSRIAPSDKMSWWIGWASSVWSPGLLRFVDLVITIALCVLVIGMWIMHAKGKRKEQELMDKIQNRANQKADHS